MKYLDDSGSGTSFGSNSGSNNSNNEDDGYRNGSGSEIKYTNIEFTING